MLKRNIDLEGMSQLKGTIFYPGPDQSRAAPNSFGIPSGRRQVELLAQWLKINSGLIANNENYDESEKIKRLITSHKFALLELVRQVAVQCLERGNLLKEIIDTYFCLLSKYFINITNIVARNMK